MNPSTKLPLWAMTLLSAALIALGSEALCRWVIGLGSPPLYEADAGFEYRLRPNQDVYRFGNHIVVNRWGMRSEDFGKTKSNPSEQRVMVFGDSVINGGSEVGHENLATSLLQHALPQALRRPAQVGNISAGGWGPGNWLAYAMRFGFFDADLVILVVGSDDARDNPVFASLNRDQPTQPPPLAVQEAVLRYLVNPLEDLINGAPASAPASPSSASNAAQDPIDLGLDDLRRFLSLARGEGRHVVVLHHPERKEADTGHMDTGHAEIAALVRDMGLPWISLREVYLQASEPVYRDPVHLSVDGQRVLAHVLQRVTTSMLASDDSLSFAKPVARSAMS